MMEIGTCADCVSYKSPGSDTGKKLAMGSCDNRKLRMSKGKISHRMSNELTIIWWNALPRIQVGPEFGCIHWRTN